MYLQLLARRSLFVLLVLAVFAGSGCDSRDEKSKTQKKPDSEFEWRSEISDMIWVDSVSGFDVSPEPGILTGPTGSSGAGLVLPHQTFPPKATITWWHGDRMAKEKTEIHKTPVAIPDPPAGEGRNVLVFTLRKSLDWDVHWETAKY